MDIVDEIINLGKKRGILTYDEINDAFPAEFNSPEEIEDFMDLLQDMGIKILDSPEAYTSAEDSTEEEDSEEHETTEDLMQAYFHSMGDISILTKDEEVELAKTIEQGHKILTDLMATLPLCKKLQSSFSSKDQDDSNHSKAITAKTLETLDRLMTKINIANGKISKYGTLRDLKRTIRVPVHMMEFYNKVGRASRELVAEIGREPTKEEIAQELGVPLKKVDDVFRATQDPISLQTPIRDEDMTLENVVRDAQSPSPYMHTEQNTISKQIMKVLNTLTPKEEEVIRMRFGIGVERNHTLEEVGQRLSITRERVRQIEAKAF